MHFISFLPAPALFSAQPEWTRTIRLKLHTRLITPTRSLFEKNLFKN